MPELTESMGNEENAVHTPDGSAPVVVTTAATPVEDLRHFQVQGKYGPMTLTFKAFGRHPTADGQITDEEALKLTQAEVEQWYERYNYPRGGMLITYRKGRYCGQFQFIN